MPYRTMLMLFSSENMISRVAIDDFMTTTCTVILSSNTRATHRWSQLTRSYDMPARRLIGPRFVERRYTRGIWVKASQAARKATSSRKCCEKTGASTAVSMHEATVMYMARRTKRPEFSPGRKMWKACGSGKVHIASKKALRRSSNPGFVWLFVFKGRYLR
jgi:hypothetical protein